MPNDKDLGRVQQVVFLCNGGGCRRRGSEEITTAVRALLRERGHGDRIHTIKTRCVNPCQFGPVVIVYPAGVWYGPVTPDDVAVLVDHHLIEGRIIEPLAFHAMIRSGGTACVGPDGGTGSHAH